MENYEIEYNTEENKKPLVAPKPPTKNVYKEHNKIPEKTKIKQPTKRKYFYIIPVALLLIFIGIFILLMFVFKINALYLIIYSIFSIPIVFISFLIVGIRLYLDRNRITDIVKKNISNNIIVAKFWTTHKRVIERVFFINKDGISFNVGKSTYIIDTEKIYFNDNGYPVSNYILGIPNPIGFDITKVLNNYQKSLKSGELFKTNGNIVDLSLSSKNLYTFKQSKMFSDFTAQTTPEIMKLLYILGAGLIVAFIVILLLQVIG